MKETEDLIKELSEEHISDVTFTENKCFCPARTFFKWTGLMLIIAGIGILYAAEKGILARLSEPFLIFELLLAATTGLLAGLASCWLSTPDVKQQKWIVWLPFFPLTCLCFIISYSLFIQPLHSVTDGISVHCATTTSLLALLPAISLAMLLKHHRTTHNKLFTATSVIAIGAFAYFCSRLICPKDDIMHLLLWHYAPTVILALIVAIFTRKFFVKWK